MNAFETANLVLNLAVPIALALGAALRPAYERWRHPPVAVIDSGPVRLHQKLNSQERLIENLKRQIADEVRRRKERDADEAAKRVLDQLGGTPPPPPQVPPFPPWPQPPPPIPFPGAAPPNWPWVQTSDRANTWDGFGLFAGEPVMDLPESDQKRGE